MSVWIEYPWLEAAIAIEGGGDIQYVEYTDGSVIWRKGVRDGRFVYDKTLTYIGFEGIEDTDWENVIIY